MVSLSGFYLRIDVCVCLLSHYPKGTYWRPDLVVDQSHTLTTLITTYWEIKIDFNAFLAFRETVLPMYATLRKTFQKHTGTGSNL